MSSLKKWFLDWKCRIFDKKYIVKAKGEAKFSVHDFRECPHCRARVTRIDINEEEVRCSGTNCRENKQLICKKGRYAYLGNVYILEKSLYSRWDFIRVVTPVILTIFYFLMFQHRFSAPGEFYIDLTGKIIPALMLVSIGFCSISFLDSYFNNDGYSVELSCIAMICLISFFVNFWNIPSWVDIPTEKEFHQSRDNIAQQEYVSKKTTIEKYKFAKKQYYINGNKEWQLNTEDLIVDLAREDFGKYIGDFWVAISLLSEKHKDEVYKAYVDFLAKLRDEKNAEELADQCDHDVWNMYTHKIARKYPEIDQICDSM